MSSTITFQFHKVGDFTKPIQAIKGEENAVAYYRWDNDFYDWPVDFSGNSAFPDNVWEYLRTKWEEIPVGSIEKYVYHVDVNDIDTIMHLIQKHCHENTKSIEDYDMQHLQYLMEQFGEFKFLLNEHKDVELWMQVH